MEKDITILKSLIDDLKREEKLIGYDAEVEIQAIENLIKVYRELEKENKGLRLDRRNLLRAIEEIKNTTPLNMVTETNYSINIDNDYIPKSKVKEKLDELDKKIRKIENKKVWNEPADTIIRNRLCNYYNALKELMEGE